jgi:hypothetical protein
LKLKLLNEFFSVKPAFKYMYVVVEIILEKYVLMVRQGGTTIHHVTRLHRIVSGISSHNMHNIVFHFTGYLAQQPETGDKYPRIIFFAYN